MTSAGNVEDPAGSVTFAIDLGRGGGGSCLPQSDRVQRHRARLRSGPSPARPAAAPTVAGGALTLPMLQGDFIANDALASNTVLQTAPSGEWTATAKVDTTAHRRQRRAGRHRGLEVREPEHVLEGHRRSARRSGNYQFEHIVTQSGVGEPADLARASRPPRTARCRPPCWCAPATDGTNIVGEFSIDDGDDLDQDRQRAPTRRRSPAR